jgi:hypothetical protein
MLRRTRRALGDVTMQSRTTHSLVSLALLTALACAHQQDPEEISEDSDEEPGAGGGASAAGTGPKAGSSSVGSGGTGNTSSKGGSSALPAGKAGTTSKGGAGGAKSTAGAGGGGGSAGSGSMHMPLEGMAAQFKAQSTDEGPVDFVGGELYVMNDSIEPLPFADLKIRYYITNEVTDVTPIFFYQWGNYGNPALTHQVTCTGAVVAMPAPKAGADTYIELTCPAGGNLERGDRLVISWKVGAQGMGKMLQTDDWSFAAQQADNDKIVVVSGNTVIWGLEP